MRDQARAVSAEVLAQERGGTHQSWFERDVRVDVTERRLAALREADAGLVFGRMDLATGECLYVGRVAISDEDNEPLVVDWRAPAAEPFYRATPGEPLGLTRRRHFLLSGRRLVGIEDDLLAAGDDAAGDGDGLVLVGEAALLAALRRARTGRMGDIVATIQREQDEIIRAPLPGVLVVQGGPGTGKTAVALHRAAYLLYTHRFPLERAGVLLLGPNRIFLRYIERVLPSLGEHTVAFATPATLVPAVGVRAADDPAASRVKGDARMATVLARAVRQRQRPLARPARIPLGAHVLQLEPGATGTVVERVKRRRGTHNERRPAFERQILRLLVDQWRRREGVGPHDPVPEGLVGRLRRERAYVAAVERMWPVLTPEALLHDLTSVPALLRLAARGVLAEGEWEALARPRQARLSDVAWAEDDVALLDEAAQLLGPVPARARPAVGDDGDGGIVERVLADAGPLDDQMRADLADHLARWTRDGDDDEQPDLATRTFGHVVVDEAQDLSPMQARMLGRRNPAGSMTVVGDLGQGSGDHAVARWEDLLDHLPRRHAPRSAELTVNYRTPAEVMEMAARVLAVAAPGLAPPRSVRRTGEPPAISRVGADGDLVASAVRTAMEESARVDPGRVALIVPERLAPVLRHALGAAGDGSAALDVPVAAYAAAEAKGLEFDAVVVVEPAALAAERPNGMRALYVALTRTTRRLHLVHARDLPAPLRGA